MMLRSGGLDVGAHSSEGKALRMQSYHLVQKNK